MNGWGGIPAFPGRGGGRSEGGGALPRICPAPGAAVCGAQMSRNAALCCGCGRPLTEKPRAGGGKGANGFPHYSVLQGGRPQLPLWSLGCPGPGVNLGACRDRNLVRSAAVAPAGEPGRERCCLGGGAHVAPGTARFGA